MKSIITEDKIKSAEKCLIDNGIEAGEAKTVLQALGYILLDAELYDEAAEEKGRKTSMAREFFIDTPIGKLRVWAKHETDCDADYPGVYIDLVGGDGECDDMLACVEYNSADKILQTCVYQPGMDEPVSIVRHNEPPEY